MITDDNCNTKINHYTILYNNSLGKAIFNSIGKILFLTMQCQICVKKKKNPCYTFFRTVIGKTTRTGCSYRSSDNACARKKDGNDGKRSQDEIEEKTRWKRTKRKRNFKARTMRTDI